jgi:DUF4097 and DUF4098 domain-containing protein YvlB
MIKTTHLILLATATLLLLPAVHAGSPIEQSRAMQKDGLLKVENAAGSIEITAWDKDEVRISGELGDNVEDLEILETSSGVEIRVRNRHSRHSVDESHVRLQIPAAASVEARSISADISLQGLAGASLVLNSVSGDLTVDAHTERLEAESVSGDVIFRGHAPRASVETVSGEMDLQGIEGEIRISTVSGDVELSGSRIERGRFETVAGDLAMELDVIAGGRLNAQSMSGDVRLALPAAQQAEFTAQTYSGDIRSDFGSVNKDSRGPGKTFSFRAGNNGASIKIESFSGDVRIRQR